MVDVKIASTLGTFNELYLEKFQQKMDKMSFIDNIEGQKKQV